MDADEVGGNGEGRRRFGILFIGEGKWGTCTCEIEDRMSCEEHLGKDLPDPLILKHRPGYGIKMRLKWAKKPERSLRTLRRLLKDLKADTRDVAAKLLFKYPRLIHKGNIHELASTNRRQNFRGKWCCS